MAGSGQLCGALNQNNAVRPNLAWVRPSSGRNQPNSERVRPSVGVLSQILEGFGKIRTKLDQALPLARPIESPKLGPDSSKCWSVRPRS